MPNFISKEIKPLVTFLSCLIILLFVANFYSLTAALTLSLIFNLLYIFKLSRTEAATKEKLAEALSDIEQKSQNAKKDSRALEEKNIILQNTERAVLNILEDTQSLEIVLQQERDRLQAVLLAMVDSVMVFSVDQRLVMANQAAMKMLETDQKKSVGLACTDLYKMYKKKDELVISEWPNVKTLALGKPLTFGIDADLYFKTSSEHIFPISVSTAPLIQNNNVWGVVMVVRDITIDKNLDEAKSNFISTASHQLRTPLTSIRWFVEMILMGDAGKISKNQKEILDQVLESSTRMISLVALLLQIARIESGKMTLNPQLIDIKNMTYSLIETFKGTLTQKGQKIKFSIDSPIIPKITLDQVLLWQVLQNLLSNAIKYSKNKTTVTIHLSATPTDILWSVSDQGIGIPKVQQLRVFEKFFRADNAVSFEPEGSGLGLPLVKNLVESWAGKIWFESIENKGTTFYMTIPLSDAKRQKTKSLIKNVSLTN